MKAIFKKRDESVEVVSVLKSLYKNEGFLMLAFCENVSICMFDSR